MVKAAERKSSKILKGPVKTPINAPCPGCNKSHTLRRKWVPQVGGVSGVVFCTTCDFKCSYQDLLTLEIPLITSKR